MNCVMVAINREPQECIKEKCFFWDIEKEMCKWLSKK